jgi:hypothetical protein
MGEGPTPTPPLPCLRNLLEDTTGSAISASRSNAAAVALVVRNPMTTICLEVRKPQVCVRVWRQYEDHVCLRVHV